MIEKPKRPKKIPNQDNKQPQTIQELIRRYDLDNTKIYDFLDELTGHLKQTQTVVSATEPTGDNREKVWIQHNKNKLNKNNYVADANGCIGFNVNLERGKTYTMSSNLPIIAKFAKASFQNDGNQGPQIWNAFTSWTFTANDNANNFLNNRVFIGINGNFPTSIEAFFGYNIQIEEGTKATAYEAYIEPKIYVKNDNDVYIPFKQDTLENYSTNEIRIGNWINGKPLYKRVWQITQLANIENAGITEIEDVASVEGQIKMYGAWKPAQAFYPEGEIGVFGWSIYNVNVATNTFELIFGSWYTDNATNFHRGYIILEYTKTTD